MSHDDDMIARSTAAARPRSLGRSLRGLAEWGLEWANPVTGAPSAPLETVAVLDAYGPSLMPRTSLHQGIAAGLTVLAARSVSGIVESVTQPITRGRGRLSTQLAARAIVGGSGYAATRIPVRAGDSANLERLRSVGDLLMTASIGGAVHDVGQSARARYPARSGVRPAVLTTAATAGLIFAGSRKLSQRRATIQRWTVEDRPARLMESVLVTQLVDVVGVGLGRGYRRSRTALVSYFGGSPPRQLVGRALNAAIWGGAAVAAYQVGIHQIGRANEVLEPAYSTPPTSPLVSGGPASASPFSELGREGRRYVSDVVAGDEIEATLGEPAVAEPIRVYAGFNSEPLYAAGRAELALDELERTGAFERSHLLLVCPTGTGWIDQTMIESAELYTRGDIATCAIQYGRYPSFLSVQKVALGRAQFRQLLWGVKQRLAGIPEPHRPKVIVFGESLGAWASSDVVMKQGSAGFDQYGIHRALWVGLPGLAKWSKTGMRKGLAPNVEPGTVAAFDHFEEYEQLTEEQRAELRAVVLDHDNDPITVIDSALFLRRPDWLAGEGRGRNVPAAMDWIPIITFVQIAVDAMNAMRTVPGQFKSFGHDYRGDMAQFVRSAYGLPPVTEAQMQAVIETLRRRELARGERIRGAGSVATDQPEPDAIREVAEQLGVGSAGVGRTEGARWLRSLGRSKRSRPL